MRQVLKNKMAAPKPAKITHLFGLGFQKSIRPWCLLISHFSLRTF